MKLLNMNKIVRLLARKQANQFEDQLLTNTLTILTFLQFIGLAIVLVLGLGTKILLLTIIGIGIFGFLYLIGHFLRRDNWYYWLTVILIIIYLDLIWAFNYGASGPVMPYLIVFYTLLILVLDLKYLLFCSVLVFVNLFSLFLIEINFGSWIGDYPDKIYKIFDVYIGMLFALILIFSSISYIKWNYLFELERAKKADQLKAGFLANLSHEIRTPLNAIVGFSSLLSNDDPTPEQKEIYSNQVQSNSDYLLRLIDDIIDVSKIESNQLQVNYIEFEFQGLLSKIQQSFQTIMADKNEVQLILCSEFKNFTIKADPFRLEQIFNNLIANAFKFTEKGSIEIAMRKENDFYIFTVKDSGIGIRKEDQELIFDRFVKIDNNQRPFQRGTGIGLYLSKKLIEMFGGKIWLESELGRGSCFYFTLPVKPIESGYLNF